MQGKSDITSIPDEFNNNYLLLLKCVDFCISSTIITPCVIAFWRGAWQLADTLLLPQNSLTSSIISYAFGCLGSLLFTLYQDIFTKWFDPDKRLLTFYIVSRIYTAVFAIVTVHMWRGSFNLCDYLIGKTSLPVILITTLFAVIVLALTKTTRNLTAPPFFVYVDHSKMYFEITTMFNTKKYNHPLLYFWDTFFSIIIVGTVIIIVWRGVWATLDLTLYPDNVFNSAVGSLIIGYAIECIAFALQPALKRIVRNVNATFIPIVADSYYLITCISAVAIWRGFWMILDSYLFQDNLLKICYALLLISYMILTALNCANSLLVRGTAIDGDEKGNMELMTDYVKLHVETRRTRKFLLKKVATK